MKRTYRIRYFLLLCLCAALCGCAGSGAVSAADQGGEQEETAASETPKPKIGLSIYRYDDDFMKQYRQELKQYLEETYQAEVIMRNARNDQAEQEEQIRGFIESGCSGIVVNPVEIAGAGRIADLCSAAQIPLVFINREPSGDERNRWEREGMAVSCVGTDSRQAGAYQGEIILETEKRGDLNGDGKVSYVMIMGEEGNPDSQYRTEYSVQALKDAGMETENLFTGHGDWLEDQGEDLARRALERYGDRIEVIFCNNDAMANGALTAVSEAGRKVGRDILITGVDALQDTVRSVKEGKITGTVLNDYTGQSHKAADVLFMMLRGEKTETMYLVDYVKITSVSTLQQ